MCFGKEAIIAKTSFTFTTNTVLNWKLIKDLFTLSINPGHDIKGNCHNKLEYVKSGCDLHGNVHNLIKRLKVLIEIVTVYCVI